MICFPEFQSFVACNPVCRLIYVGLFYVLVRIVASVERECNNVWGYALCSCNARNQGRGDSKFTSRMARPFGLERSTAAPCTSKINMGTSIATRQTITSALTLPQPPSGRLAQQD
eukprot:3898133-Amphidinium_carterae.1